MTSKTVMQQIIETTEYQKFLDLIASMTLDAKMGGISQETYVGNLEMIVGKMEPKPTAALTFGQAIEAAKAGKRVARAGWNGSGQFAYIVPAASYPAQTGAAKAHFGENGMVPYREYWALKTAQNDVATWAPSSSDSLASDWMILD